MVSPFTFLFLLLLAVLGVFAYRAWKRASEESANAIGAGSGAATRRGSSDIPRNREELTRYVQVHLSRLREAKRGGKERPWVIALGQRIIDVSLSTGGMSVEALFAAQFAVNQVFHGRGGSGAAEQKAYFARVILLYHRSSVTIEQITSGKYRDTYELTYGIWCTHVPFHVVAGGRLEREGRPSARAVLGHRRSGASSTAHRFTARRRG